LAFYTVLQETVVRAKTWSRGAHFLDVSYIMLSLVTGWGWNHHPLFEQHKNIDDVCVADVI